MVTLVKRGIEHVYYKEQTKRTIDSIDTFEGSLPRHFEVCERKMTQFRTDFRDVT